MHVQIIEIGKSVADLDQQSWDHLLSTNLTGIMNCLRAEVSTMRFQTPLPNPRGGKRAPSRGSIINMASVASFQAVPLSPAYVTSKHAVIGLTKSAAMDNVQDLIRVNAVAPGMIWSEEMENDEEDVMEARKMLCPARRLGYAEEVADAVGFLAGARSSFVTGSQVVVDGGGTMATPGSVF